MRSGLLEGLFRMSLEKLSCIVLKHKSEQNYDVRGRKGLALMTPPFWDLKSFEFLTNFLAGPGEF